MKASDLRKFYLTFSVLYGAIDSNESFKIIKKYFPDFKKEQYLKDLKDRSNKYTRGYVVRKISGRRSYVIHGELLEDDEIGYIFRMVGNKGYYTTDTVEEYFEIGQKGINIGDADKQLLEIFERKGMDEGNRLLALIFFEDFINKTQDPMLPFQKLIDFLKPENEEEVEEIFRAYQTLNNNMRLYINGGHTCLELRKDAPADLSQTKIVLGQNVTNRILDGGDPSEFLDVILNNDKLTAELKENLVKQIEDLVVLAKNTGKA